MGFQVSVFGLRFPDLWFPVIRIDRISVCKSSQSQSVYHDLCLVSVENGMSGSCLPSSVYDQIFGSNQWVWPLWSFSVSNNFAQKWVSVQRDTWINISDSDILIQGDLTQGVALDQNSFLGDTENDVWPKLNWLPPSVVLGKCLFILSPKNCIHVSVFKSSQSQSLYHDLCLDSVENGILGFPLPSSVYGQIFGRNQWVWSLWS